MDDALLVRGFQCVGDLRRDAQRLIERNRTAGDPPRKILTLDELHHERGNAVAFFKAIDARNIRMIKRGEDFRFALKTCEPVVSRREGLRQDLDRDLALQLGIGGPIHLPHAALTDLSGHLIGAETPAWAESQTPWIIRAGQSSGRG
jgi:hypothetical protein